MNPDGFDLSAIWRDVRIWFEELPAGAYALAADIVLVMVVLAAILLVYRDLRARHRSLEAEAAAARQDLAERLEQATDRIEKHLAQVAEKLDRDIAVVAEDAREARRICRALPGQLERLQAGLSAAQDEILNQSAAKFQANEAIRTAIARSAGGKSGPGTRPAPAGKAAKEKA